MIEAGHINHEQKSKPVPHARGMLLLGQTLKVIKDPLSLLMEMKQQHSDIVSVKLGLKTFYLIQSPSAARHVLQENTRNYYKPGAAKLMKKILGNGLATSNGELWLKQRRLIQPAFHKQNLTDFFCIIQEETTLLIEKWKGHKQQPVDISKEFLKLTLNNITRAMFGRGIEGKTGEIETTLRTMLDFSSAATKSLVKIPLSIPTPANLRFRQAEKRFEEIIYSIIEERRNEKQNGNNEKRADLLEILMNAFDDESHHYMTAQQLRDEITTIFMAGHETTSQTLSWIFYQLALRPDLYDKIKAEATAIDELSIRSLQSSGQTKQLIEEAMRFYPPVWIIARKATSPDVINGYYLPAGATVLVNVYGMHRDSSYWQRPGEFFPEHFTAEAKEQRPPFLYLPFGGGQRLCIGHHFAMMVMQTVVTMIVQQFEFRVAEGFVPAVDPNLTLRSKDGIQLIIKPVNAYAVNH